MNGQSTGDAVTTTAIDSPDIERILYRAVETARLAPSGHNMQPWRFQLHPDHIDLLADRSRALPVIDPDGRELTMSCGAALFYLWLSLRHDGMGARTEILPDSANRDLLARVWATTPEDHNFEYVRLFAGIPERRTNRLSFFSRPLPETLTEELIGIAREKGVRLCPIPESARSSLIALITEGGKELAASGDFRNELTRWLADKSNGFESETGITNFPAEVGRHLRYRELLRSPLNAGELLAAHESRLAEEAPLLASLGTSDDSVAACLAAGHALGHILLHAAAVGVMASFLDAPIQIDRLRPSVADLLGEQIHPQLLLAFGYAPYGRQTPRRPMEALLMPGSRTYNKS